MAIVNCQLVHKANKLIRAFLRRKGAESEQGSSEGLESECSMPSFSKA